MNGLILLNLTKRKLGKMGSKIIDIKDSTMRTGKLWRSVGSNYLHSKLENEKEIISLNCLVGFVLPCLSTEISGVREGIRHLFLVVIISKQVQSRRCYFL